MFIVGTGPSELHAHIELEKRAAQVAGDAPRRVAVLDTAVCDGQWSVVGTLRVGE